MTLLGKIFTVLILVMSVVFMSFAIVVYATHVNWRDQVKGQNGLENQVATWKDRNQQLLTELERSKNALAREQAARRFVIAALRTKLEDSGTQLKQRIAELDALQTAHQTLTQSNETAANTLERLSTEVADLRTDIMKAIDDRNDQFRQVVVLTDSLNGMQGTKDSLEARYKGLVAENAHAVGLLNKLGVNATDPIPEEPGDLRGMVTAVGERNLIEVSLGSDDGIREGNELFVYRNDQYLGRVVVRRTSVDFAVAEIIKEFNKSVLIRKGDRVATKLI